MVMSNNTLSRGHNLLKLSGKNELKKQLNSNITDFKQAQRQIQNLIKH